MSNCRVGKFACEDLWLFQIINLIKKASFWIIFSCCLFSIISETIDFTQKDGVYLCSFNRNHNSDNENDDQLVSDLNEKKRERPKKNASKTQSESTYELSETFISFQYAYPLYKAYSTLSNELEIQPLSVFLKFFTNK